MANGKNIVLLCEDNPQEQFVAECLSRFGAQNLKRRLHHINARREVHGGNVGFVERRAITEVDAWRKRNHKTKTLLVVVADADACFSRKERRERLPSDNESELYVVVVPKRNIETWIKLGVEFDTVANNLSDQTDFKCPDYSNPPSPKHAADVLCTILSQEVTHFPATGVLTDCLSDLRKLRTGVRALE